MRRAAVVAALRTPVGRYGGALASVRPDDLAAHAIRHVVDRAGLDPSLIDDVFFGATNQAGEDNRNVARMAALASNVARLETVIRVAEDCGRRVCLLGRSMHRMTSDSEPAAPVTMALVESPIMANTPSSAKSLRRCSS